MWPIFISQVEDLARLNKTEELYTNKDWYKVLKSRWSNYYDSLEKFWLKMFFRSKSGGSVPHYTEVSPFVHETSTLQSPIREWRHLPEKVRALSGILPRGQPGAGRELPLHHDDDDETQNIDFM